MKTAEPLHRLSAGSQIIIDGRLALTVDPELAAAFEPGDSLAVAPKTQEVLHLRKADREAAEAAVSRAAAAFRQMSSVSDESVVTFYRALTAKLRDDAIWSQIEEANRADVLDAKSRGRSTTRLKTSEAMRKSMIDGLAVWEGAAPLRGKVLETVQHDGWRAELRAAELGVVAFVFEGRPNVIIDATGVLRGGNTVVFRIGRDALGTASRIMEVAVLPALVAAGLPEGAVTLLPQSTHAAGWALFQDRRIALAVARGSGPAVDTLGGLAQSAGIPVSLHGTGGAWLFSSESTEEASFEQVVADSLDRKVCNTMNVCCLPEAAAARLAPAFFRGLARAAERRGFPFKLHVTSSARALVPTELWGKSVEIGRAEGPSLEPQVEDLAMDRLGHEWEWEDSPEVSLTVTRDLEEAVTLFNEQSPHFVACLLSKDPEEHARFYRAVDAPFVGDGFTRWVDGQYALKRPELGLTNWENGRLFGRGGILSGDSIYTIRTVVTGTSQGKPKG